MTGVRFISPMRQRTIDSDRYNWLRKNPAFDSEAALGAMTPEEFDKAVDEAMAATTRYEITPLGRELLKAKT